MTTLEMKCILTLARTLNFSKSARELSITQPAFSRMIVRAEEELGFKLFLRNTRSVQMTREGEAFVSSLRQAATIYKSGIDYSKNMLRQDSALKLMCAAEFVMLEILPVIKQFRTRYTNVSVDTLVSEGSQIPDKLRNRQTDIGFVFTDRARFASDFCSHVIRTIPLHIVINRENPLSEKEIVLPQDLEDQKLIVLRTNVNETEVEAYGAPLTVLNNKFGLRLRETYIADSTQDSMIRVAFGQGTCFLTSTLGFLVPPNCVMRRIDGVDFNLTALWNKNDSSKWVNLFLKQMNATEES